MHLHKWSRWHRETYDMIRITRSGVNVPYVEDVQVRECEKCGKIQEEVI